jgi:hypothetical protein
MPTQLLHTYVSRETVDCGTVGRVLPDYVHRWGICSREESHDPVLYNHDGRPLSVDSRVHIACDKSVHNDPVFKRVCRVAEEYAQGNGLDLMKDKPCDISDDAWKSKRSGFNGHVVAEMSLDNGLFGIYHDLLGNTRVTKRSADPGEISGVIGKAFDIDRDYAYNTIKSRMPEIFDDKDSYHFFSEHGDILKAILEDERVGLDSESALKGFFRYITRKTGENIRRIEKGQPLDP